MKLKKLSTIALVAASIIAGASIVSAAPKCDIYPSSISIEEEASDTIIASAKEQFLAKKGISEKSKLSLRKLSVEEALNTIKAFPDMKAYYLDGIPFTDLNFVKDLTNVEELTVITGNKCAPIDISALNGNTKIKHLKFSSSKINDLAPVGTCSNLTYFETYSCQILNNTIEPLKNLTNLEELSLYGTNVDTFAHLAPLSKLKKINVYATKANKAATLDYNQLSTIKSLEFIKAGLTQMTSVAFLKDLPNIKDIEFLSEKLNDIETFADSKIERIMFWGHAQDIDAAKVGQAKTLKKLKFWEVQDVINCEGLGNLENLEELIVLGIKKGAKPMDVSYINKLAKLKKFNFDNADITGSFDGGKELKEIALNKFNIKNDIVLDLSKFSGSEVTRLDISNGKVTNAASIIKNFPNLKTLRLVKVEGIENYDFLKDLPEKSKVSLSKGAITPEFQKELKDTKQINVNLQ